MSPTVEVLLSPAEYQARAARGFAGQVGVVFDVLRATSVMVTGLANGAAGFIPVAEIPEALAWRRRLPASLLAGERDGLKIMAAQSGGVDFDLGNSPREYTPARVSGRTIITTTTNGTRALRSCVAAEAVAVGAFLNLTATAQWLSAHGSKHLVLVCAGTGEAAALEDILCAGALCDLLLGKGVYALDDSAEIARRVYVAAARDLAAAIHGSRNGRRLLANPELRDDVEICLRRDAYAFVALLGTDGVVRQQNS